MFTIPATQTQIDKLILELQNHGTTVVNDPTEGYQINGHGVYAIGKYDGTNLSVSVVKKPFFVPLSSIENGLKSALAS